MKSVMLQAAGNVANHVNSIAANAGATVGDPGATDNALMGSLMGSCGSCGFRVFGKSQGNFCFSVFPSLHFRANHLLLGLWFCMCANVWPASLIVSDGASCVETHLLVPRFDGQNQSKVSCC